VPSGNAIAAATNRRKGVSGLISSRLGNERRISTMPTLAHRRLSVAACVWSKRHATVTPTGRQPSVRLQSISEAGTRPACEIKLCLNFSLEEATCG
jgi:hypothetical protein